MSIGAPASPLHDEDICLFTEGDSLYAAMLASIRSARHVVRLESYIFAGDEVGWQFVETLAESAAEDCTSTPRGRLAALRAPWSAICALAACA